MYMRRQAHQNGCGYSGQASCEPTETLHACRNQIPRSMDGATILLIPMCKGKRIKTGASTPDKQASSQQRRCTRVKIKFLEIWMGQQETHMYVYAYKHICIYIYIYGRNSSLEV